MRHGTTIIFHAYFSMTHENEGQGTRGSRSRKPAVKMCQREYPGAGLEGCFAAVISSFTAVTG
jgi:hypothetical protein